MKRKRKKQGAASKPRPEWVPGKDWSRWPAGYKLPTGEVISDEELVRRVEAEPLPDAAAVDAWMAKSLPTGSAPPEPHPDFLPIEDVDCEPGDLLEVLCTGGVTKPVIFLRWQPSCSLIHHEGGVDFIPSPRVRILNRG